jgi:uncharacterized membrane protein
MAYQETYQYAWITYLVAAVGMYFVVVNFSKYWKNENAKNYFKMISAVILFTPASHTVLEGSTIAPAYIVVFGELLQNGLKAAMSGIVPLLLGLLLGTVILPVQAYVNSKMAAKKMSRS